MNINIQQCKKIIKLDQEYRLLYGLNDQ